MKLSGLEPTGSGRSKFFHRLLDDEDRCPWVEIMRPIILQEACSPTKSERSKQERFILYNR